MINLKVGKKYVNRATKETLNILKQTKDYPEYGKKVLLGELYSKENELISDNFVLPINDTFSYDAWEEVV